MTEKSYAEMAVATICNSQTQEPLRFTIVRHLRVAKNPLLTFYFGEECREENKAFHNTDHLYDPNKSAGEDALAELGRAMMSAYLMGHQDGVEQRSEVIGNDRFDMQIVDPINTSDMTFIRQNILNGNYIPLGSDGVQEEDLEAERNPIHDC